MKKKQVKKLALSKESLRSLDDSMLRKIEGGVRPAPSQDIHCSTYTDVC